MLLVLPQVGQRRRPAQDGVAHRRGIGAEPRQALRLLKAENVMLLLQLFELCWMMREDKLGQRRRLRRLVSQQVEAADDGKRRRQVRPLELILPAITAARPGQALQVFQDGWAPVAIARLGGRTRRQCRGQARGRSGLKQVAAGKLGGRHARFLTRLEMRALS